MRSILVHADHDKANEVRLQTALDIARRQRAHVTLLIATPFRQFVAVADRLDVDEGVVPA